MAQTKSGAERARRHRDRKRCGTVVIQDLELKRTGIETLIARGLLDAKAADDPARVRAALVTLLNETLAPPPGRKPFRQTLKSIAFGLF
jgi:hypothetical protein